MPDRPAAREVSGSAPLAGRSRPGRLREIFRPGQPREVFRLAPPAVLWWVWLVFAAANIADIAIQGTSARTTAVIFAVLATITGVIYALAFRPRVIAVQTGLLILNPFRDHHVPWAAVQTVDSRDWVQVHYAAVPAPSSAAGKTITCWALYVSAHAKRRAARATLPPPRQRRSRRPPVPTPWLSSPSAGGYGDQGVTSRLPEEAKYLASLPAAKAIAHRLDTRAKKERTRAKSAPSAAVTSRWVWPSLAAVALPALALLIVLLA
ncbi:MAG: PH domain-containing protein [Streptosporangiaceae bacterium]